MLQEILRSAKKIRTESQLGYGAMSVAHVAIDGLSDFYESLSNKSALVVGAGHMATLALKKLLQHNIQQVTWINRNLERINNHPFSEFIKTEPLEKLPELFWQNRITVLATSARDPLLNREILEMSRPRGACLKRFSHENHVVLDLGLPRNASTDLQDLENVYVRDVDEFQDRRDKHLNKKLQALKLAEDLLQEEVHRFQDLQLQWAKRDIKKDLIRSFEYMKNQELSNLKLEKSEKIGYIVNGAYGRILHRLIAQVDELDAHNAQRFVKELIAAFKDSPELMLGGRESNNQDSSPEG